MRTNVVKCVRAERTNPSCESKRSWNALASWICFTLSPIVNRRRLHVQDAKWSSVTLSDYFMTRRTGYFRTARIIFRTKRRKIGNSNCGIYAKQEEISARKSSPPLGHIRCCARFVSLLLWSIQCTDLLSTPLDFTTPPLDLIPQWQTKLSTPTKLLIMTMFWITQKTSWYVLWLYKFVLRIHCIIILNTSPHTTLLYIRRLY